MCKRNKTVDSLCCVSNSDYKRGRHINLASVLVTTHLLEDDPFGVRGSTERIGLPSGAKMSLLIVEIGPDLGPTVLHVLTGRLQSSWLAHFDVLSSTTTPLFRDAAGKGRPKINTTTAAKKKTSHC